MLYAFADSHFIVRQNEVWFKDLSVQDYIALEELPFFVTVHHDHVFKTHKILHHNITNLKILLTYLIITAV